MPRSTGRSPTSALLLGLIVTLVAVVAYSWYITVQISGLRDLQRREALDELVARVIEAREGAKPTRPVLVKIAPDLDLPALDDIVRIAKSRGVDGLIISNTTLARPANLSDPAARDR